MRIPADSPMYHRIILDELQKKVMKYISSVNLETRKEYLLQDFMQDVQEFLQKSANFTASISAGTPSVTIAAGTTSPGPQSPGTPYRRPTPGPPPQSALKTTTPPPHPPSQTATGLPAFKKCNFCKDDVPQEIDWKIHAEKCTELARRRAARGQSPGVCPQCRNLRERCV